MSESEELRVLRDAVIFAHVTLTSQRNKAAIQRVIDKLAESLPALKG